MTFFLTSPPPTNRATCASALPRNHCSAPYSFTPAEGVSRGENRCLFTIRAGNSRRAMPPEYAAESGGR